MVPHPAQPNLLTNNYRSRNYSTSISALPSIKFDYIINEKPRISYRYSPFRSPATLSINQFEGLPGSGFPSDTLTEYHRLNDDYVIRPNLLNHLTIGYNHRHIYEAPSYVNTFPSSLANQIYLKGDPNPLVPGVSTVYGPGGATWGNTVFTDSRQRTTAINEQAASVKLRHSAKPGFDYLTGMYRRLDNNNTWGNVGFSAAGTGNQNVANSGTDFAPFLRATASGAAFRYPADTTFHW